MTRAAETDISTNGQIGITSDAESASEYIDSVNRPSHKRPREIELAATADEQPRA